MKIVASIARVLLGLGFLVFGLNKFIQFLPVPEMSGDAAKFMKLLVESGYLNVVALLEVVGGALLLLGRAVPLGLTLLGPVLINILLFHVCFQPAGLGMGLVFTILWFIVFWSHKGSFRGILSASGK